MSRTERSPRRSAPSSQLLFKRFDDPLRRAGIDEMLDVVERNGLLALRCPCRSTHKTVLVEKPMNHTTGRATTADNMNEWRQENGQPFGPMQRHPFRHEFAEYQRNIRKAHDEHTERQALRHGATINGDDDTSSQSLNFFHDLIAAVSGAERADDRDSNLRRRQKQIRIARQLQCALRVSLPLVGLLLQSPLSRGDQRSLCGREQAVEQNQHQDEQNFPNHK